MAVLLTFSSWTAAVLAEEPFRYFVNDFGIVGVKNYNRGTRISPYNRLMMVGDSVRSEHEYTATVQMRFGKDLRPLGLRHTKTNMEGWIPVVLLTARENQVRYDLKIWATPLPSVKDWKRAYDWPTEGDNFLTWIWLHVTNEGDTPAAAGFQIEQCGDYEKGRHPVPALNDPKLFAWPQLDPGQSVDAVVRLPWWPLEDKHAFSEEPAARWLNRTIQYWRDLMAKAAVFELPDEKVNQAFKNALVYQMIVLDEGKVKGGEALYDAFWMRDGAYQIMQLEEAGFMDDARKALEDYFNYQHTEGPTTGLFMSQGDQLDGNGQAPWAFWQYYKITGDKQWLRRAYPYMQRAAAFTIKARKGEPVPFTGLMPLAKGEGENFDHSNQRHIVGADLWNLRCLRVTADTARLLGKETDAKAYAKEAHDYRDDILAAHQRTGLPHFPPCWEDESKWVGICYTHWGNTETLWPTELFPPDEPVVTSTINELRRHHGGGATEGLFRFTAGLIEQVWATSKKPLIISYMSTYSTLAEMIRGNDRQVAEDYYWYLLHSSASNHFGECINYLERSAFSDTMPHVTGAAMFAVMTRHMLIHEQRGTLHLLWGSPDWWIEPGKQICIERAPTHFGVMNLKIIGKAAGVEIDFDAPKRAPAETIVLHLPKSRRLLQPIEGVDVVYRPGQEKRWDFPTVLELYKKQATPLSVLINNKYGLPDTDYISSHIELTEKTVKSFTQQQCWEEQRILRGFIDKLQAAAETDEAKQKNLQKTLLFILQKTREVLKSVDKKLTTF
jgi:hypothetical protein